MKVTIKKSINLEISGKTIEISEDAARNLLDQLEDVINELDYEETEFVFNSTKIKWPPEII